MGIVDEEDAESIAEETESESEEVESVAEEVNSEAEDDTESEAQVMIEVSEPVVETAETLAKKRIQNLESGWVGIGNTKNCHPLNQKENNRVVIRRSQRLTAKITAIPIRSRRSTRRSTRCS